MRKVYQKTIMLLLLSMICGTAFGQDFTVDGITYRILSSTDKQVETVSQASDETNYSSVTNLVIPDKVENEGVEYTVVAVGGYSFRKAQNLKTVIIPEGVKKIGERAFMYCPALETVTLPASVKEIGVYAFYDCKVMSTINLENVEKIGQDTFYGCKALTEVKLGNVLFIDGIEAFYNCTKLESVELSEGLTDLPNGTFQGCTVLKTINFPASLKTIGDNVFYRTAIEDVTLGENIESIGSMAFYYCSALKSVDISKCVKITNIDVQTFSTCPLLKTVKLPESITKIGYMAFMGDVKLESINLNDNITEFVDQAFMDCKALTSIKIPSGLKKIGKSVFQNCAALEMDMVFNSLESLGDNAFNSCQKLKSVDLTGSKITAIQTNVFYSCSNITKVVLPEGITKIGSFAFYKCNKLAEVDIPEGVTEIGKQAFQYIYALTEITLPSTLTKLGDNTFGDCTALNTVNCGAQTPPTLGATCFNKVPSTAKLNVPAGAKEAYQAAEQWQDFSTIAETLGSAVKLDFSKANYATLTLPYDCAIPEDLTVYSVTGNEGNVLTKTEVTDKIQANTPYLVCYAGTETELTLPGVGALSDSWSVNGIMAGNLVEKTAQVGDYVLQVQDGKLGFYYVDVADFNVSANHAVLRGVTSGAKVLFIDGGLTPINNVESEGAETVVDVYSVDGVLVRKGVDAATATEGLPAGIYVVGGKKMIVR